MVVVVPIDNDAAVGQGSAGQTLQRPSGAPHGMGRQESVGDISMAHLMAPKEVRGAEGGALSALLVRIERIYDHRYSQAVIYLSLFIALFALDIYDLAGVTDDHLMGLWITLNAILVLFTVEIAVCVRCKHGYVWGFFFWADVVGTMSLFFDIPWLNPLGTGNAGEATILRSSRTARIGARAARLMRLQRVVKVLRIVRVIKLAKAVNMARYFCRRSGSKDGKDEAQTDAQKSLESASHVSTELSDMLSKRVALLVMLMVISMPFLLAEPSDPHQTRVFALRSVASMREQGMRPSWAEVSGLFEFFGATAEQPFRLVLAGRAGGLCSAESCSMSNGLSVFKATGLTGNVTDTVYERVRVGSNATAPHARCCYGCGGSHVATADGCTETFARKKTNVTYIYQHPDMAESRLECDQTQSVEHYATLNIALVFFVVVLLVASSQILHTSVHKLVVVPLDRVFQVVQQAMEGVLGALEGMSETRRFADCDDQVSALEHVVRKLGKVVAINPRSKASEILKREDVSEETKEWLEEVYTTGGDHHTRTAAELDARSIKLRKKKAGSSAAYSEDPASAMLLDLVSHAGLVDEIGTLDYCALDYESSPEDLVAHVHIVFTNCRVWHDFEVSPSVSLEFMNATLAGYKNNPYHNQYHAVDTIQTFYTMLGAIQGHKFLSRLDIFAGLVAALGHDMAHPGVTNAFLAATRDELTMTYNDVSVLENMHCATLYRVLARSECNVTAKLSKQQWSDMRKTVVHSILATDMTGHFKMVADVEKFCDMNQEDLLPEVLLNAKDNVFQTEQKGRFLVDVLMHTADISNVAKVRLRRVRPHRRTALTPLPLCPAHLVILPRPALPRHRQVDPTCHGGVLCAGGPGERAGHSAHCDARSRPGIGSAVPGRLHRICRGPPLRRSHSDVSAAGRARRPPRGGAHNALHEAPRAKPPHTRTHAALGTHTPLVPLLPLPLQQNRAQYARMWLESLPEEKRAEEAPKDAERQAKFAARFAKNDAPSPKSQDSAPVPSSSTQQSTNTNAGLLQRMRDGLRSPVVTPERSI